VEEEKGKENLKRRMRKMRGRRRKMRRRSRMVGQEE
jgi:hypothetical protein